MTPLFCYFWVELCRLQPNKMSMQLQSSVFGCSFSCCMATITKLMSSLCMFNVYSNLSLVVIETMWCFVCSPHGEPDACSWYRSCTRSHKGWSPCPCTDGKAAKVCTLYHVMIRKKLHPSYFGNNFAKCWPNLIVFNIKYHLDSLRHTYV